MTRFEGDTWDIVSSVGRTALGVAAFRTLETRRPDAIISDVYAGWFVEAAGDERFGKILDDPTTLGQQPFPSMVGPRTKYFDTFFTTAAADGIRQAVIVAAGLDARVYRLDWAPGTVVFEVDRTQVLEFKNKVLAEHDAHPKADRRTVAADLRDDWPAVLTAAGFDPNVPTAWSAEGLLPYLPGSAQDALFERIDDLSEHGSRLATHSASRGADRIRLRELAEEYLKSDDSPFQQPFDLWYDDERNEPDQWLTDHGWTVHATTVRELYAQSNRALPDMPAEMLELWQRRPFLTGVKP